MPTVEQIAVERLKAGLDAMAERRIIKKHYLTPKAIFQTPETPFAYFRLSADDDYSRDEEIGGDAAGFRAESRLLLTYAIRREATYIAKELADMNALMRAMVYQYMKDPGCNLQVVRMTTYTDPYMANLYDEYGAATLAINYTGRDNLTPLEAEMVMMHYDTTETIYAGAPARTVLKSFPISAGILVDKKEIQILAQGRFAANTQNKTIALTLGPNSLADISDTVQNSAGGWIVDVQLTWKSVTESLATIKLQFINSNGIVTKDYYFPYIVPALPPYDFSVLGESPANGNITAQQLVAYLIG